MSFSSAIWMVALVIFTVVSISAAFLAVREWYYITPLLRDKGKTAQATITGHYIEKGKGISYHISYLFLVDGESYEKRGVWVSKSHRVRLIAASSVTIAYLENNPSISRLAGEDADNTYRNLLSWGAILGVMLVTSMWQRILK